MLTFILWVGCLILFGGIYKHLDNQVPLDIVAEEQLEKTKKVVVMIIFLVIMLGIAIMKHF